MTKKSSKGKPAQKTEPEHVEAQSMPHPFGVRFHVSFDPKRLPKTEILKKLRAMGSHIVKEAPDRVEMVLPPGKEDALTRMVQADEVKVRPADITLDPKEWESF